MNEIHRVRALEASASREIAIVAARMRDTLIEVLGETRGAAMYSMDWLVARVRFHLDPSATTGAVLVAEDRHGEMLGHSIVRVEHDACGPFGLFSTTYVVPKARQRGVATLLVDAGERFMVEHGLPRATTYTATTNAKLIALFTRRGYVLTPANEEMVALSRALSCAGDVPS